MPTTLERDLQASDFLSRELYHSGYHVAGVDLSRSAIEIARSLTTVSSARLRYICQDLDKTGITNLPFAPYDIITCRYVYAFINKKSELLTEIHTTLKKEGVFIMISPLKGCVPEHKQEIAVDPSVVRNELEKLFKVRYYEEFGDGFFICKK